MARASSAVLLLCSAVVLPLGVSGAEAMKIGSVTLTKCIAKYDGWCGSMVRPIDPEGRVAGKIAIGFEFYPHSDARDTDPGTIIAQEGGPGYSTTDSRDGYVRLFAPLRNRRDILLIDKRGTGRSAAIECKGIERGGGLDAVRACGRKLGDASWLYSSIFAADDVAAVLGALGIVQADYYGDSYGTFFGQVFATRHPDLLRTMVLDSAYPAIGGGPWFQTEIENGSIALASVCARSPSCSDLGGNEKSRFKALLGSLRAKSVSGRAPGAYGEMRNVTADAGALFTIVANAGNNFAAYRDIDAAARAWLDSGDPLPLLRLVAEAIDSQETGGPSTEFSSGLELAVVCADYAQLYDMRDDEPARRMEFEASLATTERNDPRIYAPFRLGEAVHAVADPEGLNLCQAWPQAPHWAAPGMPVPENAVFPDIPVLVLSGELDTVTSPREGRRTASLFPDATIIEVPNTVHETAVGNGGVRVPPFGGDLARCIGPILLAFINSGGKPPDRSCIANIRPVRTVPLFAASWRRVTPASAEDGNAADRTRLVLASATAETVGDAVARYGVALGNDGLGLRGGKLTFSRTKNGWALKLRKLDWVSDLAVSGVVDWNQVSGDIVARVSLAARHHSGWLRISWNDMQTNAQAEILGRIDGQTLAASRIAP